MTIIILAASVLLTVAAVSCRIIITSMHAAVFGFVPFARNNSQHTKVTYILAKEVRFSAKKNLYVSHVEKVIICRIMQCNNILI